MELRHPSTVHQRRRRCTSCEGLLRTSGCAPMLGTWAGRHVRRVAGEGASHEHHVRSAVPGLRPAAWSSPADGDLECPTCQRTLPRPHGPPVPGGRAPRRPSPPARGGPADDRRALVRIAQVAPLYEAVPPGAYGGTERVIATLCDGLVALGHDVTLFAPETSETAAMLEAYERAAARAVQPARSWSNLAPHLHLQMLAELYAAARRLRRRALPPRHLDASPSPGSRHTHRPDHARPAGPRLPPGPAAPLRRRCRWSPSATTSGGRWRTST